MKKQMLAVLCLLLISFCACGKVNPDDKSTSMTTQEIEVKSTAKATQKVTDESTEATEDPEEAGTFASYDKVIKSNYESLSNKEISLAAHYYTFYDVDGNGVQELLIGGETSYGIVIFSVFVMQDGVAVLQKALPIWKSEFDRQRWLFKNGTIKMEGFDENGNGYGYFRLEDGKLNRTASIMVENGEYMRVYTNDGYRKVSITKEEFEKVQKEMEGDGQAVDLSWLLFEDYKP